jgi:cob(I)alamin adenosyltransferase
MGHRLTRIVTRTGDGGETGLADGTRRPKDSPRIAALGDVDELNSFLGLLATEELPEDVAALVLEIQHDLFDLGGELAIPGHSAITDAHVGRLEDAVARFNENLPPLKEFILPGGARSAALAHVARSVCRRAERGLVGLGREEELSSGPRIYLNRLSDLLFVLARHLNRVSAKRDVLWNRARG